MHAMIDDQKDCGFFLNKESLEFLDKTIKEHFKNLKSAGQLKFKVKLAGRTALDTDDYRKVLALDNSKKYPITDIKLHVDEGDLNIDLNFSKTQASYLKISAANKNQVDQMYEALNEYLTEAVWENKLCRILNSGKYFAARWIGIVFLSLVALAVWSSPAEKITPHILKDKALVEKLLESNDVNQKLNALIIDAANTHIKEYTYDIHILKMIGLAVVGLFLAWLSPYLYNCLVPCKVFYLGDSGRKRYEKGKNIRTVIFGVIIGGMILNVLSNIFTIKIF